MSTITKEWLQQKIACMEATRDEIPFGLDEDDSNTLEALRIALASIEQGAVAQVLSSRAGNDTSTIDKALPEGTMLYTASPAPANVEPVAWMWSNRKHPSEVTLVRPEDDDKAEAAQWSGWSYKALYAVPPAPVSVPDEVTAEDCPAFVKYDVTDADEAWARGFNACRAAMLQGAEPVTTAYKLPMQPLVIDSHGTLRFKENPIVRKLLDYATMHDYGLNEMALEHFDAEDRMQLAQLIGYSLSGYGSLSYVTDESYECASAVTPQNMR